MQVGNNWIGTWSIWSYKPSDNINCDHTKWLLLSFFIVWSATEVRLSFSSSGSNTGRPEFPIPVCDHRRRAWGAAPSNPGEQRDRGRVQSLQDGQRSVQRLHGSRSGIFITKSFIVGSIVNVCRKNWWLHKLSLIWF